MDLDNLAKLFFHFLDYGVGQIIFGLTISYITTVGLGTLLISQLPETKSSVDGLFSRFICRLVDRLEK